MKISQLKALIKESIKEVLSESADQVNWDNMSNTAAKELKDKVMDFINRGETWTDSDYMEMTDNDLFTNKDSLNKYAQAAYELIRQYDGSGNPIETYKSKLKMLLPKIA